MKSSGNHEWPRSKVGEGAEAVFASTYPAIHAHLNQYRDALVKRQDQGEHWRELRACAYWDKFERPKVMYQDITWRACFCLDGGGALSNNTVYFLSTDDPYFAAGGANLCFQGAALGAQLGEAGRNDDRGWHAAGGAVGDEGGHGRRRRGDDGQIDGLRDGRQVRVTVDAQDGAPFRVDRVDAAAEGVGEQVAHQDGADAAGGGAGPEDRDGARPEESGRANDERRAWDLQARIVGMP